ncbi:MAG: hypothetical protein HKN82_19435 [Akkermansiaceae bacterium]|nr:hypothetical protein [Akkermansiaceae bacterium]NNM30671.1 hypothetical protein [Akkermansiaceae bacterium]
MSNPDSPNPLFNPAVLTRRVLFFVLLAGLALLYLLVFFRGISEPQGMDQAQIAREIARGNGPRTKVLRPVAIWQNQQASGGQATLEEASYDTYHAPLNPLFLAAVFKAVGAEESAAWRMADSETVYKLDRVVAAASVICFLMAIGVNYLLIARLFDNKIAGVTALLMLLCDLNWRFSLSGLPQMLMLLLFSCAMFFAYRAVENSEEGGLTLVPALLAGLFLALLALAHWLAIWIILGYIVFASILIRPRGIAGVIAVVFVLLFAAYPVFKNAEYTGSPGGTALLALYNGLGGSEDFVMRSFDLGEASLPLQNLPQKIIRTMLSQGNSLYVQLGSIVVAPLFFISLLHPFKRRSIATFRWGILLMWLTAVLGMSIYGLGTGGIHSNQLHILFVPLMSAYGLAFITILWSRLRIATEVPQLRNAHFFVVVLISAGPLLLSLPRDIRSGFSAESMQPHWPPYFPSTLNTRLTELTLPNEIVVSDQPWAVAWYADRKSIWLPRKPEIFEMLEGMAEDQGTPVAGILISPYSHSMQTMPNVFREYADFIPLILDGWATASIRSPRAGILAEGQRDIKTILARYPHPAYFNGSLLMYWSSQPVYQE